MFSSLKDEIPAPFQNGIQTRSGYANTVSDVLAAMPDDEAIQFLAKIEAFTARYALHGLGYATDEANRDILFGEGATVKEAAIFVRVK